MEEKGDRSNGDSPVQSNVREFGLWVVSQWAMYRLVTEWGFLLKVETEGEARASLFLVETDHSVTKLFRPYNIKLTSFTCQLFFPSLPWTFISI